jgi:hypothetical protein
MKRLLCLLVFVPAFFLASGCITKNTASKAPSADLTSLKTFYVQRLAADERGVDKIIANQLVAMGYQATAGDAATPPTPVDAVVTYQDRWQWDITMYMIQLDIQLREPGSNMTLASGGSLRTSFARKSSEAMAEEVLTSIFAAK